MSVSATTAAKRRRAGNIVSSPLFKPTNAPIENSIQRRAQPQPVQQTQQIPQQQTQQIPQHQTTNISQKPMSLQQVISVFDKRLLIIENKMINEQQTMNTSNNSTNIVQPTINNEQIQTLIQNQLNEHISEFDHRYQMLATEITNLKQIVLKLQSYTLDVNKSLIEERVQILSDMKANVVIQPEDTLNLKEDIEDIESHFEQRDTVNNDENITFSLNQNNDIKQELIQETVEESLEEQIAQSTEESLEEQIAQSTEESLEEQIAEPTEESLEEQIDEPSEEKLEEQIAEPSEETLEEQIAEPSEETLEEQIAEPSEEKLEEQIAEPSEEVVADPSEEVVIEQITSESNAKPKRKRKNKKSIPVNV